MKKSTAMKNAPAPKKRPSATNAKGSPRAKRQRVSAVDSDGKMLTLDGDKLVVNSISSADQPARATVQLILERE